MPPLFGADWWLHKKCRISCPGMCHNCASATRPNSSFNCSYCCRCHDQMTSRTEWHNRRKSLRFLHKIWLNSLAMFLLQMVQRNRRWCACILWRLSDEEWQNCLRHIEHEKVPGRQFRSQFCYKQDLSNQAASNDEKWVDFPIVHHPPLTDY